MSENKCRYCGYVDPFSDDATICSTCASAWADGHKTATEDMQPDIAGLVQDVKDADHQSDQLREALHCSVEKCDDLEAKLKRSGVWNVVFATGTAMFMALALMEALK